jgi:hypothetical protein
MICHPDLPLLGLMWYYVKDALAFGALLTFGLFLTIGYYLLIGYMKVRGEKK